MSDGFSDGDILHSWSRCTSGATLVRISRCRCEVRRPPVAATCDCDDGEVNRGRIEVKSFHRHVLIVTVLVI